MGSLVLAVFITVFLLVGISGCTKTVTNTITTIDTVKIHINDTVYSSPKLSKLEMITANVYVYDSIFNNWGLANQTLVYALNSPTKTLNYDGDRVKFYKEGTFDEVLHTGILSQGTWSMNADSSILYTKSLGFIDTAIIETLSTTKFIWKTSSLERGVQIAKQ